ncbi:MAG: methyltransferase domain-containing protein [Rubricoccaceae bacterium]|nr:methyltransferase domain-containing protein [Rubricoccaceae bacterium]
MTPSPRLLLVAALFAAALGCEAQQTPPSNPRSAFADSQAAREQESPYTTGPASYDGTGRYYLGREIARVMDHRGAAWLERPERERTELPGLVVENLDLAPDAVVADIGAGTGYFAFRIAPEVPEGRVLAVDIQPEMLAILERRAEELGMRNVAPIWGAEDDPRLRAGSVDVSLIVDAYHEFAYPREMAEAIYRATKPGGRLVLVEYRAEDPSVPIRPLHKMTEAQVRRELASVGFRFVENRDFLPQQHFLVFERPE